MDIELWVAYDEDENVSVSSDGAAEADEKHVEEFDTHCPRRIVKVTLHVPPAAVMEVVARSRDDSADASDAFLALPPDVAVGGK